MIEFEASTLMGYVFFIGGFLLIAVAAYEWYWQKKRADLMKLAEDKP